VNKYINNKVIFAIITFTVFLAGLSMPASKEAKFRDYVVFIEKNSNNQLIATYDSKKTDFDGLGDILSSLYKNRRSKHLSIVFIINENVCVGSITSLKGLADKIGDINILLYVYNRETQKVIRLELTGPTLALSQFSGQKLGTENLERSQRGRAENY
jgi:hypothetical protein